MGQIYWITQQNCWSQIFSLTYYLIYHMESNNISGKKYIHLVGKSKVKLSFQMWRIEEGEVTWLSPWPDSSWRLTLPSLGSEQLRDLVHPPALHVPACPLCRAWTDPESHPSPPQSLIPLNHTSIPITPSTSCLLGPLPQVRINAILFLYWRLQLLIR